MKKFCFLVFILFQTVYAYTAPNLVPDKLKKLQLNKTKNTQTNQYTLEQKLQAQQQIKEKKLSYEKKLTQKLKK